MARKPAKQQDDLKLIVETARKTEIDGKKFYLAAAAGTRNPLAQKMFESLAEAEEQHLKFIESLAAGNPRFQPYAKGELPARLRSIFADAPQSVRQAAASTASDSEALKVAIGMEDQSLAFYRQWAGKAASEDARRLCERLAVEEEDHWKLLSSTLEYLDSTGNWFMAQERWTFDGG